MSAATLELVSQLNTLLRLTATEAATARARVSQATTDATRTELLANAAKCDERAAAIRTAITDADGVPDLLGVAAAKAFAVAKLPLEQTLPVTEALLTDLALEHQLFDRARLVKVLAHEAGSAGASALAVRLEEAHRETIQWLFSVLAETAVGGPAALAPTPTQAAAATTRSALTYAGTVASRGVNRAVVGLSGLGEQVRSTASGTIGSVAATGSAQLDRARALVGSTARVLTAGRDATLSAAEDEAEGHRADSAVRGVHDLRDALGALDVSELPVPGYPALSSKQAAAAIGELTDTGEVRTVLGYEKAHKARAAVITAAEKRVAAIATELVTS